MSDLEHLTVTLSDDTWTRIRAQLDTWCPEGWQRDTLAKAIDDALAARIEQSVNRYMGKHEAL